MPSRLGLCGPRAAPLSRPPFPDAPRCASYLRCSSANCSRDTSSKRRVRLLNRSIGVAASVCGAAPLASALPPGLSGAGRFLSTARQIAVGEAQSGDARQHAGEASPVVVAASVEAEHLLVEVARQVVGLDADVGAPQPALEQAPEVLQPVGVDPSALDLDREMRRFMEKVEAGAEFAITQPVFDPDALLRFLDEIGDLGIYILAGIWPLASYRNATFMKNEVPGVTVPDSIMERMASVENREDQRNMGIEIARESVDKVRDRVSGIQVSAPFGRIETALAVIQ